MLVYRGVAAWPEQFGFSLSPAFAELIIEFYLSITGPITWTLFLLKNI